MTILKSIGLIFLYDRPPCLPGMCSNDDDDDDDEHQFSSRQTKKQSQLFCETDGG